MEFTGSIQFADESSWLTLTTESDDAVTIKVTVNFSGEGSETTEFTVTPNDGVARLPIGEILRAIITGYHFGITCTVTATQGSASCNLTGNRVFPCRKFTLANANAAIFSDKPKRAKAFDAAPDKITVFCEQGASVVAYARLVLKDGSESSYFRLDSTSSTNGFYRMDVSLDSVRAKAVSNKLSTDFIAYKVWMTGTLGTSDTYTFEVEPSRLQRKTYKFLGRKGTYEYIHATGKFSRSIESETQVFVTSGIEEELTNDSTMNFEQNSGHIDSIEMGRYWLDFLASKERYIVEKDGSERRIIVDEHKTTLADRTIGSLTFKWHYANPNNTVIDKVEVALTGLSISGASTVGDASNKSQFGVVYTPSNTTQRGVSWSVVSGSDYASIDESGLLTVKSGANGGAVTIRATSKDNAAVYAEKTVTVTYVSLTISVTGVSLNKSTLSLPQGGTETLVATVSPARATDKSVVWSSSAPNVAVVDQSGKVTAKSAGSAVITVTTNDGGFTASCGLTVAAEEKYLRVTPTTVSLAGKSADGGVDAELVVESNQDWTVTCEASWLDLIDDSGTGDDDAFVIGTNSDNDTGAERTTSVVFTGADGTVVTVTVTQAAVASSEQTPKIEFASDSVSAKATSTEYSMLFSAENLTDLTAACTGTLVNASARVNTSSRIIKVSFAANTSTAKRVGTVTVTGTRVDGNGTYSKSFTVVQAAAAVETYLRVTPASVTLSGTCASDAGNADLTVESNQGWTATCEADWLNLLTDTGTGDDTVNIGVNMDNNTGAVRSTSVVFTGADGTVVTVAVTQAAIENADPAEFTVTREAVSGTEWELVTQAMADEDSALSDFVGWHKSGIAGTANGETVTKLTFNVTAAGSITVEFCSDAESKYDYLVAAAMDESTELTKDNADTLAEVTTKDNQGVVNKVTKTYDLTVGTHTLQILYRKDGSRDEGTDSGYYRVLSESSDSGTDLPEGYEAVDYIASKGTSGSLTGDLPYIDTGIVNESNQTYHVEFTIYPESESGVSRTTYPFIMGSMSAKNTGATVKQIFTGNFPGGNSSYGTTGMTGEQSGAWGGNRSGGNCIVLFGVLAPGQRHTLDWNYDQNLVSVDGDTASGKIVGSSSTTVGTSNSCYLFAVNTAGSPVDGNGNDQRRGWQKLHRFWIKDSVGTLLCDLYPCRNEDGVYGLYDAVSGAFFTSANNKTFTGPDDE